MKKKPRFVYNLRKPKGFIVEAVHNDPVSRPSYLSIEGYGTERQWTFYLDGARVFSKKEALAAIRKNSLENHKLRIVDLAEVAMVNYYHGENYRLCSSVGEKSKSFTLERAAQDIERHLDREMARLKREAEKLERKARALLDTKMRLRGQVKAIREKGA